MTRLFEFHGGLRLDSHKEVSSESGLKHCPIPRQLVFPLLQRNGHDASPAVSVGERVLKGQPISSGEYPAQPPLHASTSGLIVAIEDRPLPHPSGLTGQCIVLESDGEDAAAELAGVADYRALPHDELRRRIHAAGIVGLGGAGFPTALKVMPGFRPLDTLILNGAECEPYISCDDTLLRCRAGEVLEGARVLMHILQVDRCLVAVESDMAQAIAALQVALAQGDGGGIEIVPVPAVYPMGGEKQLIRVLTGHEVPAAGLPADIGVVCHNVGTAAAVYRAVVHGEPLLSRIVTVTGAGVRRPGNWLTRIGTPIAHLVDQCGGYGDAASRLILGGPMMGFALADDEIPIIKSANCILVLTERETVERQPAMPCIRCGACADACPVELLPQQLYWYGRVANWDRLADYHLADCVECGCCDFVCPSRIPLVQHFRASKSRLAALNRERQRADHARARFEARQLRMQREQQERAEAARRKKELLQQAKGNLAGGPTNDSPKPQDASGTGPNPLRPTKVDQP